VCGVLQSAAPAALPRRVCSLHALPRALSPGLEFSSEDGTPAEAHGTLERHPRRRIVAAKTRGENTDFASTRELVD